MIRRVALITSSGILFHLLVTFFETQRVEEAGEMVSLHVCLLELYAMRCRKTHFIGRWGVHDLSCFSFDSAVLIHGVSSMLMSKKAQMV